MRKLLIVFVFILPLLSFSGRTSSKEFRLAFIEQYKDIAIIEMHKTGIPASIILAQCIHESAWGTSPLAVNANNYFGIKCKNEWQGPTYLHIDDDRNDAGNLVPSCFRSYNSIEESFTDHSLFLRTRDLYKNLFKLDKTDYVAWAKGLKKAGYATDKSYDKKLIKTILENELYIYDSMIPSSNTSEDFIPAFSVIPTNYKRGTKIIVKPIKNKSWAYR